MEEKDLNDLLWVMGSKQTAAEIAQEIAQSPPSTGVIDGQLARRSEILSHEVFNRSVLKMKFSSKHILLQEMSLLLYPSKYFPIFRIE